MRNAPFIAIKPLIGIIACLLLSACIHPMIRLPNNAGLAIYTNHGDICLRGTEGAAHFRPSSIVISAYGETGLQEVWQRGRSLAEQTQARPGRCVIAGKLYGTVLQPGVAYRASLRDERGQGQERHADFCLLGKRGAYRIHQVRAVNRFWGGGWRRCALRAAPPGDGTPG